MKSIKGKFTLFTVTAIIISVIATGLISIYFIRGDAITNTSALLTVTSENRQQSLNAYLNSIEESVATITNYAEDDLKGTEVTAPGQLQEHMDNVAPLFRSVAENTGGALSYYYKISTDLAGADDGFRYVREAGEDSDFQQGKLTAIEDYDKDDTSHIGWYTIPREKGAPVWLDPYIDESLGVRVISYVAPVKAGDKFIGVIGIDFAYDTLIRQMEDVMAFETGYAFLVSKNDEVLYHPTIEPGTPVSEISDKLTAASLSGDSSFTGFTYGGESQHCACRTLSNGMRLFVAAPDSEMNNDWENLIYIILITTLVILIIFTILTAVFVRRITDPLEHLTAAAERLDRGDYDVELPAETNDEVGVLTRTFRYMIDHLNAYSGDPNDMFRKDVLTSVRNRTAFDLYMEKMNDRISTHGRKPDFAVCVFETGNVREINEQYGHEKGDITLQTASTLICKVFMHSSVFRIGGEQFAAVLQQEDYNNRDDLWKVFETSRQKVNEDAQEPWQHVDITAGMAVFDPAEDSTMDDVLKRAESIAQGAGEGEEKEPARDR